MMRPIRFRMPDGAEVVSQDGSTVSIEVAMPADDAGHIGRRCPSCERMFRMQADDFGALPDEQRLTCPYCSFVEDHSEFATDQQQQRAVSAAEEVGMQLAEQHLDRILRGMADSVNRRSGPIRMTVSGSSGSRRPRPLPPIIEEAPIRERQCRRCGNRYAVFGEHVACPVCGPLPPQVVAEDALDAQDAALALFQQLSDEDASPLREAGALERTASSALGAVVSILETFLRESFIAGVVDQRHLDRFSGHGFRLGQRVAVSLDDAREAVGLARKVVALVP